MDRLAMESAAALKAGMSYGKWKAMQPRVEVDVQGIKTDKKAKAGRTCRSCGKEIPLNANGNRRYCSNFCLNEHLRESALARYYQKKDCSEVERVCQNCGNAIPKYMNGNVRYCSPECQYEARREKERARYQEHKAQINAKRSAKRKVKKDGKI